MRTTACQALSFVISIIPWLIVSQTMVWAQDDSLSLSATETLSVEYHTDNYNHEEDDDDYGIVINHLNLSGTVDDITAALRVDSSYFVFPDREPIEGFSDDIVRLERLTVHYTLGDWILTAGDTFTQLGQGIALAIRKVPEVGLDVALRGGRLMYEDDEHELTLFGGFTNPANRDLVSNNFLEDTNDIVTGAAYELRTLDAGDLGFFGLYFEPQERIFEDRDLTVSGGLYSDLNAMADWLTIYLEGDVQYRELAGISDEGLGAYATVDMAFGDLGLLMEGLYLSSYELRGSRDMALGSRFSYNLPPTLERIDQEVFQTPNVAGGRLRVDYYFFDFDLLLYGNGMFRLNEPGEPAELRQIHGYGGAEIYFQEGSGFLNLSGGYRDETQQDEQLSSMIHAELDLVYPLDDLLSLHLLSTNELRTRDDNEYQRGTMLTGVEWADLGGIAIEFGYDTEQPFASIRNFFLAGSVAWDISDQFQLSLTGGSQRGGIRCVNGVCRDFPAFTGARGVFVGRF